MAVNFRWQGGYERRTRQVWSVWKWRSDVEQRVRSHVNIERVLTDTTVVSQPLTVSTSNFNTTQITHNF